jgi:GDPmannose 4,6-dehydratase
LITGVGGQDGVYLARLLGADGVRVVGTVRPGTGSSPRCRAYLGHVELVEHDVRDSRGWEPQLDRYQPDEIYNLAAMNSVGRSWEIPELAAEVNGHAVAGLLEAVRTHRDRTGREVRVFHASSAAVLDVEGGSPYAHSKGMAQQLVVEYRERHSLRVFCGILSNHESPLRGPEFVTRKITVAAAEIAAGRRESLRLGNLDVRRDWGCAGEYVEAMQRIVRSAEPADLEIGTGVAHELTTVVETAFCAAGIDDPWSYVTQDPTLLRPQDTPTVQIDPVPAELHLGWKATIGLPELITEMVRVDTLRIRTGLEENSDYLTAWANTAGGVP